MTLIDILNSPWAIVPSRLQEIQEIYKTHLRGEKIDLKAVEAQLGKPLANEDKGYSVLNGVAILSIQGVISKRMNMFSKISGGVSTELLGKNFTAAYGDPTVKAILLEIDSPGGSVDGTQELANLIYEARQEGAVKVVALSNGLMASAAYWIGSAAEEIYITGDTVEVGSIGVVATHVDISRAEDRAGVKTTEITAGRYKRIHSQYAPLSEEGAATIQDQVDQIYSIFVGDVARNRGTDPETVLKDMADGRIFIGQKAIEAGLVDGVSTLDRLMNKLAAGAAVPQPKPFFIKKEGQIMTLEDLKVKFPEQVQAIIEEARQTAYAEGQAAGKKEGIEEGARTERDRIMGVEAQSLAGHEALIQSLKFDGKTTGPEAAVQILQAEKKVQGSHLANFQEDGKEIKVPAAVPPQVETPAVENENLPLEDRAKMSWDTKPEIRDEFMNFDAYLAFRQAEMAGRVKILRRV